MLLLPHKINKAPRRKEINMEFLMIYLILTPFLCMAGMFLIDAVKDKIKSALAKKAKAVVRRSCSVEKLTYSDNEARKAV